MVEMVKATRPADAGALLLYVGIAVECFLQLIKVFGDGFHDLRFGLVDFAVILHTRKLQTCFEVLNAGSDTDTLLRKIWIFTLFHAQTSNFSLITKCYNICCILSTKKGRGALPLSLNK